MKELPCIEEIYDLETFQLERVLQDIDALLLQGANNGNTQQLELPKGFETFEKFERKALKLKEHLELELDERKQVDDVINFFVAKSPLDILNDDQFYKPTSTGQQQQPAVQQPSLNDPLGQIQQRYNQQLQNQQQLNSKNLAMLQQQQQQQLKEHNQSTMSAAKVTQQQDNKLETDTQFSEYLKQNNDETQSLASGPESSDLSKKMFGARMNKKDMQQFMKEKLAKTKIASESLATAQSIGLNQNNFKKVAQQPAAKKELISDTHSTSTSTSAAVDKQTIYKPNLKRKPSDSTVQSSRKELPASTQSVFSKQTRADSQSRKTTTTVSSVKEAKQQKPKKENKPQQPQAKTEQSTIYKPNIRGQSRGAPLQRPPLPKQGKAASSTQQNANNSQQAIQQVVEDSDNIGSWNSESNVDDKLMGQEEIESKYSDGQIDQQMNEYKVNIDEVNEQLESLQVIIPATNSQQTVSLIQTPTEQSSNQSTTVGSQRLIDKDDLLPKRSAQLSSLNNQTDLNENQEDDQDEEEKANAQEYGNEEDDGDYAQQEQKDDEEVQEERKLELDDMRQANKQTKNLEILTEPSSTTSKRIRGKVQVFVDEAALSALTSPKVAQGVVLIDSGADFQHPRSSAIQSQLEMLEKQDEELNMPKQQAKEPSKRLELIQKIKYQDDSQKKAEQEQRIKEVRDQIQKEKQQAQQVNTPKQSSQNQSLNALEPAKDTKTVKETKQAAIDQKNALKEEKKAQAKKKVQQQQLAKVVRQPEGEQYLDYSGLYKNFYEIFPGLLVDPKGFDLQFVVRETRNTYAAFVNIMDANALGLKKKFQFEQAPLEKSLQDYYAQTPNYFALTGKSVNELDLELKNRNTELMMQAMAQAQLRNNFNLLKQKDVNDIVKQAQTKVEGQSSGDQGMIEENRESSLYYRVVKNRSEVYDIISRAFSRKQRWNELPHGLDLRNSWNLLWTWSKIKIDISKLLVWQRCNHYNGAKNVSRKDFLKRNLERAQKMSQKAANVFNIIPLTFILPKEYVGFLETFSEYEDKEGKLNYWIMKPAAKSRGRGISLVNDLTQIVYGEPIVVQRYLKNPLLINGYKFDLRIYVLVTSVNPIEIFLYKEGFGRFSTIPFSLDPTDKNNKYIHLTNVSIQKYNQQNSDQDAQDLLYGGTKISLQTLKKRFQSATNVSWDDVIWPQIRDVVVKSMVACQNDIAFNSSCFELFGFDIMIDSDFKCWLIEINSSPSLARETLLDDMIKQRLIDDTIDLVDPVDFDRKRLFEVLERRINEDFKQSTTSNAYSKKLMNRDLTYILNGQMPRKFGEMPKFLGNYERIAPSPQSDSYLKLIGGQKMFGSMGKVSEIPQLK